MYKALLNLLFPSFSTKDCTPDYFVFEKSHEEDELLKKEFLKEASTSGIPVTSPQNINYDEHYLNNIFYQYLFGDNTHTHQNNELSRFVSERIEMALVKPKKLIDCLPILPLSVTTLLAELNKPNFNTDILIEVIEKEPSIAGKVIELANSPYYHRGHKEITDLRAAFMAMGAKGLIEGVINGFIHQLTPKANVYYKQFGEKIWQHSLDTGHKTKALLNSGEHNELAGTGYFVGLFINLGYMVIFQLMMEAFSHIDPEAKPDVLFFQNVLDKYALKLTHQIAHYWALPKTLNDGIAIQLKINSSDTLSHMQINYPIAVAVYESRMISKMDTMLSHALLDERELTIIANKILSSATAIKYIQTKQNEVKFS